jgi:hypothetical protein
MLKNSLLRRGLLGLAAAAMVVGLVGGTATPAAADTGHSNALWISAHDGGVNSEQWIEGEPTGWYHIHYWRAGGGWNVNGSDYYYPGRIVYGWIAAPGVARGDTVCAELWRNEGGSYGLPCVRMD